MGALTDAWLHAGDPQSSVRLCERMLRIDPLREDNHRRLMLAYFLAGRRPDVVRQYDVCVRLLRSELDVGPAPGTEALYRQLRQARTPEELAGSNAPIPSVHRPADRPGPTAQPTMSDGTIRLPIYLPGEGDAPDNILANIVRTLNSLIEQLSAAYGPAHQRPLITVS
jgi:hypothetical protein